MADETTQAAPSWFGKLNTVLTAIGAIFAALATILSTINKGKIDRVNAKVAELDLSEKRQKTSNEFADIFIKQVLTDPALSDQKQKHIQALLSVLNIVAQSNNGDKGEANARARAIVPLQLALLLGQPGGLAAMDADYKYTDDWVAMAYADDSDVTRVTAIKALGGICQKALRAGRLDVVAKGVEEVDQLFALIAEQKDPKNDLRIPAIAARLQLATFIKREDQLVTAAMLPKGIQGDPMAMKERIRTALSDAVEKAQNSKAEVQRIATGTGSSSLPENVGQLNAALARASEVARQESIAAVPPPAEGPNEPPAGPEPPAEGPSPVDELIKDFASNDSQASRRAISKLALYGQSAVEPLIDEVRSRFGKNEPEDGKVRTAVASALRLMNQPINLDANEAWWVVNLLGAQEQDVRDFTADFLSNRFPGETMRILYDQLEALVEPLLYPNSVKPQPADARLVYNAAFIVSSWAKLLDDGVQSREKGEPMNIFCRQKAAEWRDKLKSSPYKNDWRSTVELVNRLVPQVTPRS